MFSFQYIYKLLLLFFFISSNIPVKLMDLERYRAGQLQAERMLEAREQSHRQQIHRLENQVNLIIYKI